MDSPTGIRRVWFVLVAGLGLATAAMVTALTVDRSAPATPHYQDLREALVAGTVSIALDADCLPPARSQHRASAPR